MPYTRAEYEAFYYINLLLPKLEKTWEFRENLVRFNVTKEGGLLCPVPKTKKMEPFHDQSHIDDILAALEKESKHYPKLKKSYEQVNVRYLVKIFGLSGSEQRILDFLIATDNNYILERFFARRMDDISERRSTLELIGGFKEGTGEKVLGPQAPLFQLGVLCHKRSYCEDIGLSKWARGFLRTAHKNNKARYQALVGKPIVDEEPLQEDDFTFVQAQRFALNLIKQAAQTKGFNVLLYGYAGTGKTSFAKMLARSAGLDLYGVGENSQGSVDKNFRLCQLYRKQCLFKNMKNTCLLFDEAEDIFSPLSKLVSANKVEINRLLEENARPVIWATNNITMMDPAFVRRFTLAIPFEKPPRVVREKIWRKYLDKFRITLRASEVRELATHYEVPPAMIAGAVRAASLVRGKLPAIKEHLSLTMQALNGGYKKQIRQDSEAFYPALIHADTDLTALAAQIKQTGRLNFSLCLYGASGTGKSAYARYLAQELGLEVIHKRASDLKGMFVGETEKNIAHAFAQAREEKALLIFDEADSFLRDRALAHTSWEVSAVNEMLTWMESHPYPFICTTNLMDTLDPASLRRFSFKVKYEFLTAKQVCEAFDYFFGLQVAEEKVRHLTTLTPGDFAVVKNKADILGKHHFEALAEMLEGEQKVKKTHFSKTIGFGI